MVSRQEKIQLQEIRDRLDVEFADQLEDWLLIGYLRACKMDVQTAVCFFKLVLDVEQDLTGRKDQKLNFLNYQSLQEISTDVTYKYLGCGNDGRPVFWIPIGHWNPRHHVEKGLKKEFWLHVGKCAHEGLHELYKLGERTGVHRTAVLIIDMKGLTLSKLGNYELVRTGLCYIQKLQKFANILHKIYFVNGPLITQYAMKIMKPFLKKSTSDRIEQLHLHWKESDWQRILRKQFPVDILPIEYNEF